MEDQNRTRANNLRSSKERPAARRGETSGSGTDNEMAAGSLEDDGDRWQVHLQELNETERDVARERKARIKREELAPANESSRRVRLVSPPRDKYEEKPVKGILRSPREKFPEDPAPIREGVAPLKDATRDGIPLEARWTKISRKLVNPEALEAGKERFEARDDFVIVLRVLSRDEVQGYADVTQRIRGLSYPHG